MNAEKSFYQHALKKGTLTSADNAYIKGITGCRTNTRGEAKKANSRVLTAYLSQWPWDIHLAVKLAWKCIEWNGDDLGRKTREEQEEASRQHREQMKKLRNSYALVDEFLTNV